MIIEKVLEKRITLTNPNDIYTSDVKAMLFDRLSSDLTNKCYQACLILKISKILRFSNIYMSDQLDGSAYINVLFQVDAVVFREREIIPCCRIEQIESNGQIYANSEHAKIQIVSTNTTNMTSIVKTNDIIPVSVYRVSYVIGKDKISVLAMPFSPHFHPCIYYRIKPSLPTEDEKHALEDMKHKISTLEFKINSLSNTEQKSFDFFKKLLYPYKTPIQFDKQFKLIDLDELENTAKSGVICRPVSLEKHIKKAYIITNYDPQQIKATENTLYEIIIIMYNDFIHHMNVLLEMTKCYPTIEIISKYANIWKIYNLFKE